MKPKVIAAIYNGATMSEIVERLGRTPEQIKADWQAWRDAQRWPRQVKVGGAS